MPETETQANTEMLTQLRRHTRDTIERKLSAIYRVFGAMDREELGAMLDGAQDAVMNWTPPKR